LLSVAISKNFRDDHYFMFPATGWRGFATGVLHKALLPVLLRPVVRFSDQQSGRPE